LSIIANLISSFGAGSYGITGVAGSGKTTLTRQPSKELGGVCYSADYRFFGDSQARAMLMQEKLERSFDAYRDSVNQFNWWDWSTIMRDLDALSRGNSITI